jgi:hypothetical protein
MSPEKIKEMLDILRRIGWPRRGVFVEEFATLQDFADEIQTKFPELRNHNAGGDY